MNLVACMIVYNGMPFLPYCIKSLENQVDTLIIVYGAQKEFKSIPKDKTYEYLDYLWERDTKPDLYIIEEIDQWNNEAEQRNAYLEFIKKNKIDVDWLLIVDSDEFYTDADIGVLRRVMEKADDDIRYINYPFYNFYYSFNFFKKNYDGMLKCIRYRPELIYHYTIPQTLDNIGDDKRITLWGAKHIYLPQIRCYHYGHLTYTVKFKEKEINKLLGSCERDYANPKKWEFISLPTKEKKVEWILRNYKWFNISKILVDEEIEMCRVHPKIIEENFISTNNYERWW